MINSAKEYPLHDIFNIEAKLKYVIPKFQREYIWGKNEWEELFNDLKENDIGYYLGSIILINKGKDTLQPTPLEVIDGQQRITTISLLYAAIYDRFLKEKKQDEEDFVTEKNNLKYRLTQKGSQFKNQLKLELSYQNNNFADYQAILNEIGIYTEPTFKKPHNLGNRIIYKAYRYFKDKVSNLDYRGLLEILNRVNSALVVKIEVDNHADAFILFESLNNRGIPLSAMDLIKNELLAQLESEKIKSIDEAFNEWVTLVANLPDYSVQERFLRQYYNAFRYNTNIKVIGHSRATKSTLIKIYDDLIKKDVNFIFGELIRKSKIYNAFIEPKDEGDNAKYHKELLDLLHIGAAPSYALLLYLFSEHKAETSLITNTINFLVKYFVWRNLTDIPATRDLDIIFLNLIDVCENNKNKLTSDLIIKYLTQPDKFPGRKLFKEKLEGDIYENNSDATRFILCKIEEKGQTKEIYADLWKKDENNRYIWTIEHIFPEGKTIPTEWVDMIAGGDQEMAKELQTKWVHKLGNLTLTGYNSNLSNFSFQKKRERQDSKGNYIGFKNGLYINEELAVKKSWTMDDISHRTNYLIEKTLELFDIET